MTGKGSPTRAWAGGLQTWRESPRPVKALVVGLFVNRLGGFLLVFLVLYLVSRGFTATQAGTALGTHGAGSIAGVLAGGWLADQIGPRRAIVGSSVLTAALLVTLLHVRPYPAVLAVAFAAGAAGQAYRPLAASVLSRLTAPDRQVMVFATYRLALNLGTTVAPLLGAALVAVSYSLLFYGEAAAVLGYAALVAALLPADATPADAIPADAEPVADQQAAGEAGQEPVPVFGSMVALNGLLVITCELPATTVTQRWRAGVAAAAGIGLTGLGLSLYAPGWGVAGLVLATVLWTFGEIVSGPTMSAYPATATPPALRGRYLGASHAVFGLGFALGPPVGVATWNRLGDAAWWCCGAVAALAALAATRGMAPTRAGGSTRWTNPRSSSTHTPRPGLTAPRSGRAASQPSRS